MASLDIDTYKDFVLKLKIKGPEGSNQIRRVRLPRITDSNGNVSFEELVGLVITFHFPRASPGSFNCSLTYVDEDEDTVTIASVDELVDAVEQFADKNILRITTEVTRKASSLPPTAAKAPLPTPNDSNSTTDSNRTERSTTAAAELFPAPQIQKVLESAVDIVASAVNSLEKEFNTPSSAAEPKQDQKKAAALARVSSPCNEFSQNQEDSGKEETKVVPPAEKVKPNEFIHARHTCDSCLKTPIVGKRFHASNTNDYDLCKECFKNYSGKETDFLVYPGGKKVEKFQLRSKPTPKPSSSSAQPLKEVQKPATSSITEKEPTIDSLPFIHGRHTCDSCLTTPIVGKRFHAMNIKDYDLCEKCNDTFGGSEIQFEPVELPRDRAFQKRWYRRRQRIESMKARAARRNRSFTRATAPPPPTAPSHVHLSPCGRQFCQTSNIQTSCSYGSIDNFDGALKEAIRRSLEDILPNEIATEKEGEIAKEKNDATYTCDNAEETYEPPVEASFVSKGSFRTSSFDDVVDEQELFEAMEIMSVDSEKMIAKEGSDLDTKPAAISRQISGIPPKSKTALIDLEIGSGSPKAEQDDSFALDAIGNGDAAEAMGATLDTIAGAISEMLSEAETNSTPTKAAEPEIPILEEKADLANVEESEQENEMEASGTLILNSEDQVKDAEDDWQVVEEAFEQDNEMAQATQMLGSALFNSDMKSSNEHENISTLTTSDCFSSATSVPSTVSSIHLGTDASYVAPSQRARWLSQLEKLHELGFDDETLCVETLERLQAANIGCNEEDEISVTQVVNQLLGQK